MSELEREKTKRYALNDMELTKSLNKQSEDHLNHNQSLLNAILNDVNGFLDAMEKASEAEDIKTYKAYIATIYSNRFVQTLNDA